MSCQVSIGTARFAVRYRVLNRCLRCGALRVYGGAEAYDLGDRPDFPASLCEEGTYIRVRLANREPERKDAGFCQAA